MSIYMDRYLILSERGFEALKSQAHDTEERAIAAAVTWHEHTGDKIVILQKKMVVEAKNVKVKSS